MKGVISISYTLCIFSYVFLFLHTVFISVNVELLASLVIWVCFAKWLIELVHITHGIANVTCLIIHPFIRNLLLLFNEEVMQNNICINNFQNVRQILFLNHFSHNHSNTTQPEKPGFPYTNHMFRFDLWL